MTAKERSPDEAGGCRSDKETPTCSPTGSAVVVFSKLSEPLSAGSKSDLGFPVPNNPIRQNANGALKGTQRLGEDARRCINGLRLQK